jgi:hypothetical protein
VSASSVLSGAFSSASSESSLSPAASCTSAASRSWSRPRVISIWHIGRQNGGTSIPPRHDAIVKCDRRGFDDVKLSDVKICSGMAVSFENQHTFHFSGGVKLSDVKICSWTAVSFDSHHNLSLSGVNLSDIKICSWMAVSFDSHHNVSFFWCGLEWYQNLLLDGSKFWDSTQFVAFLEVKLSDVKICSWMAVSFASQHNLSYFLKEIEWCQNLLMDGSKFWDSTQFALVPEVKLSDVEICSWMAVSFDSHHNLPLFLKWNWVMSKFAHGWQ